MSRDFAPELAKAVQNLKNVFRAHGLEPPKSIRLESFEQGFRTACEVKACPGFLEYVDKDMAMLGGHAFHIAGVEIRWPAAAPRVRQTWED